MTSAPDVTVVVPVFKGGRFVSEALDSVAAQSMTRWECLIVDDGGDDGSADVAREWAARQGPSRARVLSHPRRANRGVARSRNLAVAEARGTWLAFLDQDDLWDADKLEADLERLGRTDAPAMLGSVPRIRFDARPCPEIESWGRAVRDFAGGALREVGFSDMLIGCPLCLSTVVARRDALVDVGLFPIDQRYTSDWTAWTCMAWNGRVCLSGDERVTYRIHDANEIHAMLAEPGGVESLASRVWDGVTRWLGPRLEADRASAQQLVSATIHATVAAENCWNRPA